MALQKYPLILWAEPEPTPLLQYLKHLKSVAVSERTRYADLQGMFDADYIRATEGHPELSREVLRLTKYLNDLEQSGGGAADTVGVYDSAEGTAVHPDDVAHRFLVKNAYRSAAKYAHPDKGGSNEEFALLSAAYKAQDLDTIQSFVVSKIGTLHQRLHFWYTQACKPRVTWTKYCSSVQYQVVVLRMQKNHPKAHELVRRILYHNIADLMNQINETLKRKSHGKS